MTNHRQLMHALMHAQGNSAMLQRGAPPDAEIPVTEGSFPNEQSIQINGDELGLHIVERSGARIDLTRSSHHDEMEYFSPDVAPIVRDPVMVHVSRSNPVVTVPSGVDALYVSYFSPKLTLTNIPDYISTNTITPARWTYDDNYVGPIGRGSKKKSRARNKIAKASRKRNRK